MALPKTTGSNPESATLTKDVWTLIAQNVNACKISNKNSAIDAWWTYKNYGENAPTDLTVPKWKIGEDELLFQDGITARDVYVYPIGANMTIEIEV